MSSQSDSGQKPTPDRVKGIVAQFGLGLSQEQARQLAIYLQMLMHWNTRMNLVGPKDWATVCAALVTDSLHLAALLPELGLPEKCLTVDVGAGAGVPGIPLRICWCRGEYLMLEPRQKRAVFLQTLLASLKLPGTTVRRLSAEALAGSMERKADLVLSRGVRPWREFLTLAGPLLRDNGSVLVFSNRPWPVNAAAPPGWTPPDERPYVAAKGATRYFWLFSPNMSPS
jgi:16S rRNA (guanine527-N7)-methyltransferase